MPSGVREDVNLGGLVGCQASVFFLAPVVSLMLFSLENSYRRKVVMGVPRGVVTSKPREKFTAIGLLVSTRKASGR